MSTISERLLGFFLSEFGFVIGVMLFLSVGALVVELWVVLSAPRRRRPRRR